MEAKARHYETSHAQLRGFIRWGLVPEPVDGIWPPEAVDRVVEARRLGEEIRPLWRRAILMARKYRVPPAILREAMIRTLPSITSPKRKMTRITRAVRWQAAQQLENIGYSGMIRSRPAGGSIDPAQWKRILTRPDVTDREFGETVSFVATMDLYLELATRHTSFAISRIAQEERLILLTIRQLARLPRREVENQGGRRGND